MVLPHELLTWTEFIHIGRIIPSLTQEEVLFSCCPEAFLCLLVRAFRCLCVH